MNTFQLNGHSVRSFQIQDASYLITSDANDAFGFMGDNTALDKASIPVSTAKALHSHMDKPTLDLENLPDRMLVIERHKALISVIRSNRPELAAVTDIFGQMLDKAFAQNFGKQNDRPMLPAVSDDVRVAKMASAASSRKFSDKEPQDKINYPGWSTITEMLTELGEDCTDENSLIVDSKFRFWLNRQISDLYRAQFGEEPPDVKRKKGHGFCYPPSYLAQIELYRSTWSGLRESA
jgi:hypothetical protein